MIRGEIWLAEVGRNARPVLVLTRSEVIDVRALVTVAEITTSIRGLSVEVPVGADIGLDDDSVINCDGIHTLPQTSLTARLGELGDDAMASVCAAVHFALGCSSL